MSGINPAAGGTAANAAEAAIALELQALAADAQALRALLLEGDVVQATVQPFNGITDTLEIMGLRVAASLPPNVRPGDTLTVAVQGFKGDQVLVQVLSSAPPPEAASPPPTSAARDSVELTQPPIPVIADDAQNAPSEPPASAPSENAQPSAPGRIAQPGAPSQADQTSASPPPQAPPGDPLQTRLPAPPIELRVRPENLDVEARVALARSAALRAAQNPAPPPATPPRPSPAPPSRPPSPAAAPPPGAGATRSPLRAGPAPPSAPGAPPVPPRPPNVEPRASAAEPPPPSVPVVPRAAAAAKAAPPPLPGAPTQPRAARIIPPSPARVPAPTASELLRDPPALLRALRIPVTPTTLTFAKLVTAQPEQVATALRALETGLPPGDDPRVATLRTLAAFVGTLDPRSPTFTTQIGSYLTHVIEGPEQKLLALVREAQPAQSPAAAPAEAEQSQAPPPAPPAPASAGESQAIAAARVAERVAAADADLKTQLVAVLTSPQAETALGDAGAAVARNALTALVATQLSTAAAQQSQPGTWTFTIPITIDRQVYPAKISVSRDGPKGRESLSSDDFHIVFILETQRLGTVAVDVHAVARSVSVAVRTERASAEPTFKEALAKLGARLEEMRYNVKSLDASVARSKGARETAVEQAAGDAATLDRRA
jgi:hypothetical protein